MGKYELAISGTFFEGQHSLSVEASDVEAFLAAISAACGLDGVAVSVQYEDPDFNEWCEVDDLDDLAQGQVAIRLKAPQGTVLNMAAAEPGPAPAPPPDAADDETDDFTGPTVLESTVSIDFSSSRGGMDEFAWLLSQSRAAGSYSSQLLTALSGARMAPRVPSSAPTCPG
eukprot:COSAG02_NODE_11467_length_1719_cov_1.078395_1_plen_171_part_00